MSIFGKYVGIPYVHKGRSLNGLDCWGLVVLIYRELFNMELLDMENYEQDWAKQGNNYFLENYSKQFEQVENLEKYDIILFKVDEAIRHAGIYLGDDKFIHCPKIGVVISRLSIWKKRIAGCYRLKK